MSPKDKAFNLRMIGEQFILVDILRKAYGNNDEALHRSIKKACLSGDNGLEKQREHPEKILEIILPLILSYKEVDDEFREVVDTLVNEGITEFYSELCKVILTIPGLCL